MSTRTDSDVSTTTGPAGRGPADPETSTDRWYAPRLGRAMEILAVAGVVVSLCATTVGWIFLSDLDRNLDRSLAIGEDAAATLSDTIDVADDIVATTDRSLVTLANSLDTVSGIADNSANLAGSTASLAAQLPESFEEIDAALATVESLSGTVDSALRALSSVPFGPDYDPEIAFPDAVGGVRSALDPIGDDLRAIADDLSGFDERAGDIDGDLDEVRSNIADARRALDDSAALLERYRTSSEDAETLARTSREDFDRSLGLARAAVVLLGAFLAVAQFVPWSIGRRLRAA